MTVDARPGLREEIEQFLYREALLLDSFRFHEWLELLTDDVRYQIPTSESVQNTTERFHDDGLHFGLMDETRRTLEMRVRQLDTGLRHVEVPPSTTERLITNVLVEPLDESDEVLAYSKFLIVQIRHGTHENMFSGRREDRLRRVDGQWKLAGRKVYLTQTVLPRTISIFL